MAQGYKEENLSLLEKGAREAGFPEDMVGKLRDHVLNDQSYAFYIIQAVELMERRAFASLYYERPMLTAPYQFKSFNLSITGERRPVIHENQFILGNGYDVSLREAMNLMEGRMVFRQPSFDKSKGSYWVSLGGPSQWPGRHMLDYRKLPFRVEEGLEESGFGKLLDMAKCKLVADSLKSGDRVEVRVAPMGQPRTVWLEADPLNRRLLVTNNKRQHVGLPGVKVELGMEERVVKKSKGIHR